MNHRFLSSALLVTLFIALFLTTPGMAQENAWQAHLRENPDAAVTSLDRQMLERLTVNQWQAVLSGVPFDNIELASGDTLQEFLERGVMSPDGMEYFPLDQCVVAKTRDSVAGKMAADEARDFLARGEAADLSAQGGSAIGCGIPLTAEVLMVNISLTQPEGIGKLKMWPATAPDPNANVLRYENTSGTRYDITTPVRLSTVFRTLFGDFAVETSGAAVHVRIEVLGYFSTSAPAGSGPTTYLDGTEISNLGLTYGGGEAFAHRLISNQGYFMGLLGDGNIRTNIVYFSNMDCTGDSFVDGVGPGGLLRWNDNADPKIYYAPKSATLLTDPVVNGSRRVTSACQTGQNLVEGVQVFINNSGITGFATGDGETFDPASRHFVTFNNAP